MQGEWFGLNLIKTAWAPHLLAMSAVCYEESLGFQHNSDEE